MSKPKYIITCDRDTAVRYIAWEFGVKGAQARINKIKKIEGYGLRVSDICALVGESRKTKDGVRYFTTKCEAENIAQRISNVAAYQAGKLGKSFSGRVTVEYFFNSESVLAA